MNFKKRVNGSWTDTSHYLHNTSTDTITTLPADIYANAATATVGLKGQTVQSGTPTPQNPVMPNGCGERTGNLFNDFDIVGQVPSVTNGNLVNYNNGACTDLIELSSGLLTLSIYEAMVVYVFLYDVNESFLGWVNLSSTGTRTTQQITNYENAKYARVRTDNYSTYLNEKKIMLNTGSTALPYEPYGIKIPISSANTTTPVYLGEVQSTRQIKKLVLDGTETGWTKSGTYQGSFFAQVLTNINITANTEPVQYALCSHAQVVKLANFANGTATLTGNTTTKSINLWIGESEWTVDEFKSYLATQYAAGTPVTIWYVLATPQTAVVNEPIRKIGEYADTVSGISVPTIAGADSFDVLTTLKPSEVTVNYHGWHTGTVHERESGSWD